MSNSGSGRYTHLSGHDPEALPDPNETAREVLEAVPHFFEPDVRTIFTAIEAAGLTFCWKVNP